MSNTPRDPDDANSHLEEHLDEAPPELRDLFHATHGFIVRTAPELHERLQHGRPCLYGQQPVATIEVRRDSVHLCLFEGGRLADPAGLLRGTGSTIRYVEILDDEALQDPNLAELVRAAVRFDANR